MDMVIAALNYATGDGWPVFPVGADKRPLTKHGFKAASRDPRLITEWWTRYPDAGIGFAIPEGLLVFDIDPRNGGVRGRELPRTKEAGTRSGGQHLYYRVPPDLPFKGQYSPGVDLKSGGKGYVILPPTPGYSWVTEWTARKLPDDVLEHCVRQSGFARPASPPQARVNRLPWEKASRYGEAALTNQAESVRLAREGERNNTLFKATASITRLVAGGELDEEYALAALLDAARYVGLDEDEAVHTMQSAYAVGITEPRGASR